MSRGRGYVEQLPSGRWRARLPRRLAGAAQRGETFDTEDEALDYLGTLAEQEQRGDPGTLLAWGKKWLQRREARGLSSYPDDEGRWRQHVAESDLAGIRLVAIKPPHVLAFVRRLATRRTLVQVEGGGRERTGPVLSRLTQAAVLKLVKAALSDAVLEGLIPASPAAEVRIVPQDEGEDLDAWTWLRQEEIDQVLSCAAVPADARACFAVAIYAGLRAGELWALDWSRVVLEGERPHLLVAKSNRRRSTKSGKVRTVPLLEQARGALEQLLVARGRPAAGLVFPGELGQRARSDTHGWADRSRGKQGVSRGWKWQAGIRRPVRFHDLRHTCASHLLQGTWGRRWRLEEDRDFLGHSSITVTQRYAHLCSDHLHAAAAETAPRGAPRLTLVPTGGMEGGAGLGGRAPSQAGRGDQGDHGAVVVQMQIAASIAALVAAGDAVPKALLGALADAELDQQRTRLALAIREGGEHALDRALELVELVLGGAAAGGGLCRRRV